MTGCGAALGTGLIPDLGASLVGVGFGRWASQYRTDGAGPLPPT